MSEIPTQLLLKALDFYSRIPDGQYDLDVVVPLIQLELSRRPMTATEVAWRNKHAKENR